MLTSLERMCQYRCAAFAYICAPDRVGASCREDRGEKEQRPQEVQLWLSAACPEA